MRNIILFIIALAIVGFIAYKYFGLDTNQAFQKAWNNKDIMGAETVAQKAVFDKVEIQAKSYFKEHNNYFISKTNNVCIGIQSLFSGLGQLSSNPVECSAKEHTFTARLKIDLMKTSYCADSTGFYTTALDEPGFQEGVKCK